ncbi:rhodanese-like domain-containing protein 4A, chloroplastic isoform X2 [Actinidia eriantha]|uniref:rhodanese-like domain-containing protein 4A, chloroplastic isoform X2 n=1 Tax=Actinidia eriantha TaxID=165200 RepID=UPI0025894978|nr:rhodanese-like domain-containing protein 4A, chloroplastic isoform X2 [Actinidia eriantha]
MSYHPLLSKSQIISPSVFMESLSIGLSSSPSFQNRPKTLKPISNAVPFQHNSLSTSNSFNSDQTQILSPNKTPPIHRCIKSPTNQFPNLKHHKTPPIHRCIKSPTTQFPNLKHHSCFHTYLKTHLSFLCLRLSFPLSSFASDTAVPAADEISNKINLEAIVVSIDDFFNRNPFFVARVTFIWLVVIPLTQEFLQKYKFVSAIDAFRKLRDDPNSQLLDIRDKRSLQYLGSPNLKIVNKGVVQVEFSQGDEEGFVRKVLEKLTEPEHIVICILDNFDGNSLQVAELLYKNGFKEAYAIRGGVRGKKGWQAIQESLLPPSVHIFPKKKVKMSQQPEMNGGVNKQSDNVATSSRTLSTGQSEMVNNGYVSKATECSAQPKDGSRSLSPYPNV